MITYKNSRQFTFDGFHIPFDKELVSENRWMKLSKIIPWDGFAQICYRQMSNRTGCSCKDTRLVIEPMLIRHKLNLSDEETVQQIQEDPYLQFFVGFSSFTEEQPFAPTPFNEIRKRRVLMCSEILKTVLLAQLGKSIVKPEKDHLNKILMDALHHIFCQNPENKGHAEAMYLTEPRS